MEYVPLSHQHSQQITKISKINLSLCVKTRKKFTSHPFPSRAIRTKKQPVSRKCICHSSLWTIMSQQTSFGHDSAASHMCNRICQKKKIHCLYTDDPWNHSTWQNIYILYSKDAICHNIPYRQASEGFAEVTGRLHSQKFPCAGQF